jgi:uncharacterized protein YkwD
MKRLIFVICAIIMMLAPGVAFADSSSMHKSFSSRMLDASSFVGMTETALKARYGGPARTEPSEYGFTWYIYSNNYNRFFMAGVQDGKVVAFYTNAKTMSYGPNLVLGSTKASVRSKIGKPVTYISANGSICILNNTDQKDIIPKDNDYVIVFYDKISGGGITSILIVPKAAENNALLSHPNLSNELVAAYQRISVDLINSIRVRNGLKALATDKMDSRLAVSRSSDMRDRNYFSHYTPAPNSLSPFDQAKRMGIKFTSMGENIAYGDHNAIIAHEAFMNSAGHRYNVLSAKYKKIGAGVAYGGSRYVLLTDIFQN